MPQLIEGQPQYIQGSGAKPYELKNVGGVYSCSCPAWRNQGAAIDRRTCKHLKQFFGEEVELARTMPAFSQAGTTTGRLNSSAPNIAASATSADAQTIMDRAASQGRKLRQDEKAKLNGPPVLLAHPWEPEVDPTGYHMSEKLDGVRCYWDNKRREFITRQGNTYKAPDWFIEGLPDHPLDGELWMGRQLFQQTMSIVRRFDAGDEWKKITFLVFDLPHVLDKPFEERMVMLESVWRSSMNMFLRLVHHEVVTSKEHLLKELETKVSVGAEGLMLRQPGSLYVKGRSHTLLKVKPFKDAEATVIGHTPGKGRHKGTVGALVVQMPNGKEFNLGTGLTDADRRNPPKIGEVVTYSYTELTNDGIPKCGAFVRVRPPE